MKEANFCGKHSFDILFSKFLFMLTFYQFTNLHFTSSLKRVNSLVNGVLAIILFFSIVIHENVNWFLQQLKKNFTKMDVNGTLLPWSVLARIFSIALEYDYTVESLFALYFGGVLNIISFSHRMSSCTRFSQRNPRFLCPKFCKTV